MLHEAYYWEDSVSRPGHGWVMPLMDKGDPVIEQKAGQLLLQRLNAIDFAKPDSRTARNAMKRLDAVMASAQGRSEAQTTQACREVRNEIRTMLGLPADDDDRVYVDIDIRTDDDFVLRIGGRTIHSYGSLSIDGCATPADAVAAVIKMLQEAEALDGKDWSAATGEHTFNNNKAHMWPLMVQHVMGELGRGRYCAEWGGNQSLKVQITGKNVKTASASSYE